MTSYNLFLEVFMEKERTAIQHNNENQWLAFKNAIRSVNPLNKTFPVEMNKPIKPNPQTSNVNKFTFYDNSKKYKDRNAQRVIKYLNEQHGIDRTFIECLFKEDLIRGYSGYSYWDKKQKKYIKVPPHIKFMHKVPRSIYYAQKKTRPSQEKNVGDDQIYIDPKTGTNTKNPRFGYDGKMIDPKGAKDYGWNFKSGNGRDYLFVFQSPIDAMSYYQLNKKVLSKANATFLSISGSISKLNTIDNFTKAQYLNGPSQYKRVFLCPNKDAMGQSMITKYSQIIGVNKLTYDQQLRDKRVDKDNIKLYVEQPIVKGNDKSWNDILKGIQRGKYSYPAQNPIPNNYTKHLTLYQFGRQIVSTLMNSLSKDSQQKLELMMFDYSVVTKNYLGSHSEPIVAANPRIQLAKKVATSIPREDLSKINQFMEKEGGKFLFPEDLFDYTSSIVIKKGIPTLLFKPVILKQISAPFITARDKTQLTYFLNQLNNDDSKQGFFHQIKNYMPIIKYLRNPLDLELKKQASNAYTEIKNVDQYLEEKSNSNTPQAASYKQDIKKIKRFTNRIIPEYSLAFRLNKFTSDKFRQVLDKYHQIELENAERMYDFIVNVRPQLEKESFRLEIFQADKYDSMINDYFKNNGLQLPSSQQFNKNSNHKYEKISLSSLKKVDDKITDNPFEFNYDDLLDKIPPPSDPNYDDHVIKDPYKYLDKLEAENNKKLKQFKINRPFWVNRNKKEMHM